MRPLLLLLPLLASPALALYPFGPEIDQPLPQGDDVSLELPLSVPVKFYGQTYPQLYINTNGLLSFLTEIPKFFNEPFPLEYPVIAPLYSNVDTRRSGVVLYRESREPDVLSTVAKKVAALYPSLPAFLPLSAVVVTWKDVGYYDGKSDKVNTYQVVISSDGSETFVELLYPENGVAWIRAESPRSSLPDAIAQAGLSSPGGKLAVLKGSGTDRVHNLPRWTNTFSAGEYMFRVGNIEDTGQPEPPQRSLNLEDDEPAEPQNCAEGSLLCHKFSECNDEPEGGFCCRCQSGYFGNGRNCLDLDSHRMLGKLNISINGVESKDLNMQAFIVTSDGRTYTAISGAPQVIGYDLQLLISLGSFVGFLFAKPTGDAPNGYQLTGGVVNHTAELTFDTRHRITIRQRYSGLDLFEQVKMEAEVTGTLPSVPPGTRLNVLEFQEQFTRIGPGLFRSQSTQVFEIENTSERHEVAVDQTIQFHEYCPSAYRDVASLRLKSSRHYLSFEEKDSILRLASTNKISKNTEGQDPCVEGHVTCVANSTCLVEDDSFRCVCNPGFQTLQDQPSDFGCVDINECEDRISNCHGRALCVNEVGSYSCQCLPGYTGDGRHCEALEAQTIPNGFCRGYGAQQVCDCNQGFIKQPDESEYGFRCEDIDECIDNACGFNSFCYNTPGGFQCECFSGFQRIGLKCVGNRGCDDVDCPEFSLCRETNEGPECSCQEGYSGTPPYCRREQGGSCEDTDCPEYSVCRETAQGPDCICQRGYYGTPPYCTLEPQPPPPPPSHGGGCEDTDCPEYSVCQETIQGPECICQRGYFGSPPYCTREPEPPPPPPSYEPSRAPLTQQCRADEECRENFICDYNSTENAYICMCRRDYVMDGDACIPPSSEKSFVRTCVRGRCWCPPGYDDNGDLCVLPTSSPLSPPPPPQPLKTCRDENNCHPNAQCIYVPTKDFECKCNPGFEGDGYTCTEFDVSCTNSQICGMNAECRYDSSSNRDICICNEGYQGDGMICYASEEQCAQQCHSDAVCISGTCVCNEGFVGDGTSTCERSIPDCNTLQNCHPDADCLYDIDESGYRCKCRQGYEGDGYSCSEIITCRENPSMCSPSASCIYISPSYECKCMEGFFGNGTHCKEINRQDEEFLLLNKGRSTIRLPFSPSGSNIGRPIQINGDQHAIGIAIDCIEGRVYWSDIMNQKIKSSKYDGSDVQDFIVSGVKSPEGLTIDWINRILYWTDSVLHVISSARLDDRQINHIIKTGLVNPRGIAVHPHRRKLFWSDWNRKDPIIESSDLDGRNREVLIQKPSVMLPNSLAIDWNSDEICWADAGLKKIQCFDVYQRVARTVVQNCLYPFGLAITSDAYYWTDWSTGKVESSNKGSGVPTKSIPLPIGGDDKLYGLVAVTSSCPN